MTDRSTSNAGQAHIVIVGGGVAGLECALALRALAGDRTRLTLISDSPRFAHRPAATAAAFGEAPATVYDLAQIAADVGANFQASALEAVLPQERTIRLNSGQEVAYDALVLAAGATAVAAVPGAFTFRDQRDVPRFKDLLKQVTGGGLKRLVFAVPSRLGWSLPAYELAFHTARYAAERSIAAQIALVTAEPEPLAVFGHEASRRVAELLAERDVRLLAGALPHSVEPDGALALQFDAPVPADAVVAIPKLQAARVAGIPASWSGFVPTDAEGRIEGLADVYAAGDITTYPIKQGGLAAQQADRVAQTIAAELGVEVKEMHDVRVLRARLLTGDGSLVLRTELDSLGAPTAAALQHRESRADEIPKVFGRYLTPYIAMYGSRRRADTAVA